MAIRIREAGGRDPGQGLWDRVEAYGKGAKGQAYEMWEAIGNKGPGLGTKEEFREKGRKLTGKGGQRGQA